MRNKGLALVEWLLVIGIILIISILIANMLRDKVKREASIRSQPSLSCAIEKISENEFKIKCN